MMDAIRNEARGCHWRVSLAVNDSVEMYLAPKLAWAFTRAADLPIGRPSIYVAPRSRRVSPRPRNQRYAGYAER